MKYLAMLLISAASLFAQSQGNVTMVLYPGVPTGTCNSRQLAMNTSNGQLYTCNNGSWQIVSGGGAALNGCDNNTIGTINCQNAFNVTVGAEGVLSLAYSALPTTPPSGTTGALAADGSGVLNWSPGNGAAFTPVGAGGGGVAGPATALTFGSTTISLSAIAPGADQFLYYDGSSILGNSLPPLGGVVFVQ